MKHFLYFTLLVCSSSIYSQKTYKLPNFLRNLEVSDSTEYITRYKNGNIRKQYTKVYRHNDALGIYISYYQGEYKKYSRSGILIEKNYYHAGLYMGKTYSYFKDGSINHTCAIEDIELNANTIMEYNKLLQKGQGSLF